MKTRKMKEVGAVVAALGLLAACAACKEKGEGTSPAPPPSQSVAAATPAPAPSAVPSATASTVEVAAKTFACGSKGQSACPMQGWMKKVMAAASSGEDGDKLAKALAYVATRPPPGFGEWTAIAQAGVEKAKAGDLEGAKESCRQCHDKYKETYKATMRDRAF